MHLNPFVAHDTHLERQFDSLHIDKGLGRRWFTIHQYGIWRMHTRSVCDAHAHVVCVEINGADQ